MAGNEGIRDGVEVPRASLARWLRRAAIPGPPKGIGNTDSILLLTWPRSGMVVVDAFELRFLSAAVE